MIRLLLASGADVNLAKLGCRNEKTRHDETPLMLAANGGDLQLARRLLNKGAKVDIQDSRGFTALAYGASDRDMLAELLANNADIHVGNSPLVPAIEQNNYQAVENLLEAGADVNKKDSEGTTPLMLAVKVSSPDILVLLLSAGARTSDKDNMGRTAEMFATLKHADEMVALLRNAEK
jgi:ankyrin repeat protein